MDVVTFSYSLTMIPDWFLAVDHAWRLLRPGGTIGVVDFYVSRKHPDPGWRRHPWSTPRLLAALVRPRQRLRRPRPRPLSASALYARSFLRTSRPDALAADAVLLLHRPQAGAAMKRVLLTGGRAAAALELARLFRAAGWRVVVAESLPWHPSRWSRAVARSYVIPWPNRDPGGCIDALVRIIRRERIDLLVPTCEEIFYIAKWRDRLDPHCTVFTENIETLRRLHSKWLFVQAARGHGLAVPPTVLLTSPDDAGRALASGRDLVLKPVYSRFASRTIVRPRTTADLPTDVSEHRPWVAQDFVPGRQVCTYSVAHAGRLTVHSAYLAEFTFGLGAAVAHAALDHPASRVWVEAFVCGGAVHRTDRLRLHRDGGRPAVRHRVQPAGRRAAFISSRTMRSLFRRLSAKHRGRSSRAGAAPRCTLC